MSSKPKEVPPAVTTTILDRAKQVALSLQFGWFCGHLLTVIFTVIAYLSADSPYYYRAYYATLLSYGIILYKAHSQVFALNQQFLTRVIQDENSLYFMVSVVWATANPVKVSLIPYAIFSLFHTLGYIRTEIIPKIFPGVALGKTISAQLNTFMISFQPLSINAVARIEVWVIFPMSIITILWGGTSIFTPFLYSQFLQFRFMSSLQTRQTFGETEVFLDKWILANASVPPMVQTGYSKIKEIIQQYLNLENRAKAQQQQQPPVQADAPAK